MKSRLAIAALAVSMLCTSCVVWSIFPFCAKDAVVKTSKFDGSWRLLKDSGTPEEKEKPWEIKDNTITLQSANGEKWTVTATYFKVGEQLFVDTTAEEVNSNAVNGHWLFHRVPFHILSKVEMDADTLTFKPLSYDWLTEQVTTGKVDLPHVKNLEAEKEADKKEPIIYTATPVQWMAFIKKFADNPDAFPVKGQLKLKKETAAK